jgi:hypothetical protein
MSDNGANPKVLYPHLSNDIVQMRSEWKQPKVNFGGDYGGMPLSSVFKGTGISSHRKKIYRTK